MKKETSKTSKSADPRKKLSPEVRDALDAYHAEMKDHIEALSEEHQARTSAVAEQYLGLNEKIDLFSKEVKGKLDMHTEMIGVIMEDVAVLKEDVAEIKKELKTKADKTEVIHLSRRVSVLEHTS
jgi:hypothetical protein